MSDAPKKDKKDKKDKKEKKDKKDKKDKKKKVTSLGEPVEAVDYKSTDEYLEQEKFKPVRNPSFNPSLISPMTSPTPSIHSVQTDEKWALTANRSRDSLPAVRPESPLTPAELQGYASAKYIPSGGYGHLDPTKHEGAHSAFDQLQKVVANNESQPPVVSNPVQPKPVQQQQQPIQKQQNQQQSTQQRSVAQTSSKPRSRPERLEDGAQVLQYGNK